MQQIPVRRLKIFPAKEMLEVAGSGLEGGKGEREEGGYKEYFISKNSSQVMQVYVSDHLKKKKPWEDHFRVSQWRLF